MHIRNSGLLNCDSLGTNKLSMQKLVIEEECFIHAEKIMRALYLLCALSLCRIVIGLWSAVIPSMATLTWNVLSKLSSGKETMTLLV
jgi:hypothetical protein